MIDSFGNKARKSAKEGGVTFSDETPIRNSNHKKTAFLLVDFQNEFAKKGGKLYDDVKSMMESNDTIKKVAKVLGVVRNSGILVIHSPVIMKEDDNFQDEDYDPHSYGALQGLFTEGTWNAEIIQELKPELGELTLKNRTNFSAFQGTGLASILKKNRITSILLAGFLTNVCIEETVREMVIMCSEITIHILSDGCASKSEVEHNYSITTVFPMFDAKCITCAEAQTMLASSSIRRKKNCGGQVIQNNSESGHSRRPNILALSGNKSNSAVTKLQLENLRITKEDYDIDYLEGQIEVEEADPRLIGLIHGPFYSWIDIDNEKGGRSLIEAVHKILTAVHLNGPYDGIYGFSVGGLVASIAANIVRDTALQEALDNFESDGTSASIFSFVRRMSPTVNPRNSLSGVGTINGIWNNQEYGHLTHGVEYNFSEPPFKFIILACSGFKTSHLSSLRKLAGLPNYEYDNVLQMNMEEANTKMEMKSFHLIGIEDELKAKSEEVLCLYKDPHVMYLPGGHGVSSNQRSNDVLCYELKEFICTLDDPSPNSTEILTYTSMSEVTSIGLHSHHQIAKVELRNELLPQCMYAKYGGATITALLRAQPAAKAFLYNARNTNISNSTTYGDLLNFIRGGDGDLRHLGVRLGEVVAYGAPPGGSAAAAVSFLSIAAQTTAAPLAPGMMESDVKDVLNQFNAKHLILFEGVDNPGTEAAFLKYAESGAAILHRATITGDLHPGLFKYINTKVTHQMFKERSLLVNPEKNTCLLLRTSGTTARPKGIPLSQGALVTNGAIIAKSMQLQESDVCYSVMPLFHIGGISASIMCTIASGGSISCDGESFDPSRMVEALALSSPQPTWYSSVPTIHNSTVNFLKDQASNDPKYMAYGVNNKGIWKSGHSLRMIRSGAAVLHGPDGDALNAAYGGVPIYPTYSMSEQMPISQPPAGKIDTFTKKPGSVGVPAAASTVIVNRSTLRPQPYGVEGEIAISGPTVLKKYFENPLADMKSYFFLSLPNGEDSLKASRYFLTGDLGTLDTEGFLFLKGRAKELIKKGGEQVSPFEVEELLVDHPWVQTPICFAVQNKMYGEEVGCALVLSSQAPVNLEIGEITKVMRRWLKEAQLAPIKWPTKWVVCTDSQLSKTKTKKYIRIGMAKLLGLDSQDESADVEASFINETKAEIDWAVLGGLRFVLACYVMFIHIGSAESWGSFNNLRGFPWHVHMFFTLGGFSMASPMNPTIKKKFSYFVARIGAMYPMYAAALILGLINLLIVCRPSTFRPDFHWDSQLEDLRLENGNLAPLFCEGTPATPNSYWGSLILTILTNLFGLTVTPNWPLSWWMGYYLWFSSMYYQCLAMFPAMYNFMYNQMRKKTSALLRILICLLILNHAIISAAWYLMKNGTGYDHYNKDTGGKTSVEDYDDGKQTNIAVLSFYLFGPFWALYFFIGIVTAFLYDSYCPNERHRAYIWGLVADIVTIIIIGFSVAVISQGTQTYGKSVAPPKYMRPDEADDLTDISVINRLWDNVVGRTACPLTTIWIFALSTGKGYTAAFFRSEMLSVTLAPNAYNCFLFHQMVAQWYFAATRNGHMWNWWRYRKIHYWFSPEACPVEWYEYPTVVGFVVVFSIFMDRTVQPIISEKFSKIIIWFKDEREEKDLDTAKFLMGIIENITGIEPELDYSLDQCGLASVGVPRLVSLLNKSFSTMHKDLEIVPADLIGAKLIVDMVEVIDACISRADEQGV